MIDSTTLLLFASAALVLLIAPGPAVMYIVARSVEQGRAAGLVSVLGIALGALVHVGAAALGLSAVLVASATAFGVVKYVGAAYLIYLGVQALRQSGDEMSAAALADRSLQRIFRQGVAVNILNPKLALFFFAFLPQFVDPARGAASLQFLLLGLLFVAMALVSDSAYALLAGSVGERLRHNLRLQRAQRRFAGGVYIALGVTAALSDGALSRSKQ